jgi:hypothetical protein
MDIAFGVFRNDSSLNRLGRTLCLSHISRTISDSKLRELVIPKYPLGCRRILISNEFYPALQRPNVSLITDSIKFITTVSSHFFLFLFACSSSCSLPFSTFTPTSHSHILQSGIQTSSSLDKVDCIILATGFQVTKFLSPLKIFGRNGLSLEEKWSSRKVGGRATLSLLVLIPPPLTFFFFSVPLFGLFSSHRKPSKDSQFPVFQTSSFFTVPTLTQNITLSYLM